jgi:hypothetical protein
MRIPVSKSSCGLGNDFKGKKNSSSGRRNQVLYLSIVAAIFIKGCECIINEIKVLKVSCLRIHNPWLMALDAMTMVP